MRAPGSTVTSAPDRHRAHRRRGRYRSISALLTLAFAGAWIGLASSPGNLREALEAQRALVAADPANPDLLNDLGNLLGLAGYLPEAEEAYRRALALEPGNVTSLYNLGLILQEQGRPKEARQTLETVIEIDPRHAWAHYQLGILYEAKHDRDQALEHYETAFGLDRSLTSPKVNPHIVENRLVTAALLELYLSQSPSTQAPRLYEQPGDVAEMLLPRSAAGATGSYGASPVEGSEASDSEAASPSDDGPSPTRTLDESSLRPGSNQASAQTVRRSRQGGAGKTATPQARTDLGATSGQGGGQPPGSSGATGQSRSYVPGVESTGRLELEVLPASAIESRVIVS